MLCWSVCGKNYVKNIMLNEWMGVVGLKLVLKWIFDEVYLIFRILLESFYSFCGLKVERCEIIDLVLYLEMCL